MVESYKSNNRPNIGITKKLRLQKNDNKEQNVKVFGISEGKKTTILKSLEDLDRQREKGMEWKELSS